MQVQENEWPWIRTQREKFPCKALFIRCFIVVSGLFCLITSLVENTLFAENTLFDEDFDLLQEPKHSYWPRIRTQRKNLP